MSKPKVFEKPIGVKDYLPDMLARLRAIETRVLRCMESWGYRQLLTPTLEYYDTVGAASATHDRKLFKLLDRNGRTLVLRSDMTAPIARVAASLLNEEPLPLRLSYHANVFRAFEEEAGRDSEFFQTGVELIGDASPEADAEVIALAVESLKAAGVNRFKIALGHAGFINGMFKETLPGREQEQTYLKECLLKRDYVGFRQTVEDMDLPAATKQALADVLRLYGGREVIDRAAAGAQGPEARRSLAHLREMFDVLQAYGVDRHVFVDLTMVGNFSYYTGMIFEGYAADLGFPVCSGGRYDNLLTQFDRPAPATGFALKTNRILEIADGLPADPLKRVLVLYDAAGRQEAFRHAAMLRETGEARVETRLVGNADEAAAIADEAAAGTGAGVGGRYAGYEIFRFVADGGNEGG